MYFWIDRLMSSRIWTVIFLFDKDGPVILTSLRLKVSPESRAKNTRNRTMVNWPKKDAAPTDPIHSQSFRFRSGWRGATAGGGGAASFVAALLAPAAFFR